MRLPRLTVLQALLLVAVIAVGLDSLVHPTRYRIRLLLWVEVSLLVFASFLARYASARTAAWWFGFACFGWAQLVHTASTSPCFPSAPGTPISDGFEDFFFPFNIAETITDIMISILGSGLIRNHYSVLAVVRFWMLIGTGVIGGYVSLFVHGHQGSWQIHPGAAPSLLTTMSK